MLRYTNYSLLMTSASNETLRLQAPVATALQHAPEKGSGGKWIGNEYVMNLLVIALALKRTCTSSYLSVNTAVSIPPYVLHRDPRYFSPHTNTFWPDQ